MTWDKFDRQEVESVHDFEDRCAEAVEIEEAMKQETDSAFEELLGDWQKRLNNHYLLRMESIKVDANSELLMRQLRKNGIV